MDYLDRVNLITTHKSLHRQRYSREVKTYKDFGEIKQATVSFRSSILSGFVVYLGHCRDGLITNTFLAYANFICKATSVYRLSLPSREVDFSTFSAVGIKTLSHVACCPARQLSFYRKIGLLFQSIEFKAIFAGSLLLLFDA